MPCHVQGPRCRLKPACLHVSYCMMTQILYARTLALQSFFCEVSEEAGTRQHGGCWRQHMWRAFFAPKLLFALVHDHDMHMVIGTTMRGSPPKTTTMMTVTESRADCAKLPSRPGLYTGVTTVVLVRCFTVMCNMVVVDLCDKPDVRASSGIGSGPAGQPARCGCISL
jgi:hypothetical protein